MVLVVGHRGAAGLLPENTFQSFERAIDLGVDAIEFDVRLTKDDVPIVFHDETVDRMTDGTGPVAKHTWAEIERLVVTPDGAIPRLSGVLDRLSPEDIALHVDVKTTDLAVTIAEQLRARNMENRAIVFTSHRPVLEELLETSLDLGFSVSDVTSEALSFARQRDVTFLLGPGRPDPKAVELIREAGMRPGISTVNDGESIRQALQSEPYSLLTDRPDIALAERSRIYSP